MLRVTFAPAAPRPRPRSRWHRRPRPRSRARRSESIMRFASSRSSGLPVSFHQPLTISARTVAAVVDQPLDRLGDLVLAAPRRLQRRAGVEDRVAGTGTRRRARRREMYSLGFSTRRTTRSPSRTATPKCCGSVTRARKICASGAVRSNSRTNRATPSSSTLSPEVQQERLAAHEVRAVITACAMPSGAGWWMNTRSRPQREPSPTAARTSSPSGGPTTMPTSTMPAARSPRGRGTGSACPRSG